MARKILVLVLRPLLSVKFSFIITACIDCKSSQRDNGCSKIAIRLKNNET